MEENQASPTPEPTKEKKGCSPVIVVILTILTLGGIGFGIFELLSKPEEKTISCDCPTCKQAEQQPETTEEEKTSADDYLYISEWGIKVKKPEGLNIFHYAIQVNEEGEGPWYERAAHISIVATSEKEYELADSSCNFIIIVRTKTDEDTLGIAKNSIADFDGYSYAVEVGGSPCVLSEESYESKEQYENDLEHAKRGGQKKLREMFSNVENYEKL